MKFLECDLVGWVVGDQYLDQRLGYSPPPLLEQMAEDAQKIHQERPILKEILATATRQEGRVS